MKDATRIIEMVEELTAELRHADSLIALREEHIASLEAEIALLRNLLGSAHEAHPTGYPRYPTYNVSRRPA